jgi:hypothetical protein
LGLSLVSLCLLAGCAGLFGDLRQVLYPTGTPLPTLPPTPEGTVALPTPIPVLTATPVPLPTLTPEANLGAPAAPEPPSDTGHNLLYVVGERVYRSGYLGQNPVPAASIPQLEAWGLADGRLALIGTTDLLLLDLNTGGLVSLILPIEGDVLYSQVLWSASGEGLLVAAVVEDLQAPTYGRRVELFGYAADGSPRQQMTLYDLMGVVLLSYDEVSGQALLIPMSSEQTLLKAESYDLNGGRLLRMTPLQGTGDASVSPDGRYILTQVSDQMGGRFLLFDRQAEGDVRPRVWQHADGAHALSPVWSPDGRYLAYLLVTGDDPEAAVPQGLWLLDLENMKATRIVADTSLSSSLAGWTPDGAYIVGFHHSVEGGSYYYALRPDGGGRQIMPVDAQARLLGWMPAPEAEVAVVVVDPWQRRFAQVERKPDTVVALAAAYLAEHPQDDPAQLSAALASYLGPEGDLAPRLAQIGSGTFLVELASTVYVVQGSQADPLVSGKLVDARRQDNSVGVILGIDIMGAEQQTYLLLEQTEQGAWRIAWTPQGQSDWIATDGAVRFAGEGLSTIEVRGSSLGLDAGDDEVFVECRECPHRWLVGTWVGAVGGYQRETTLAPGASLDDIYWEMTERSAYAVVYEALRRMRREQPLDQVIDRPAVVEQARDLGLLEPGLRLLVEDVQENQVRLSDLEGTRHFVAQVKEGRLTSLKRR